MTTNISTFTLPQSETLKLHIVLERKNIDLVKASFLEFPSIQIEAPTEKQALEELNQLLYARLENLEIIPVEIKLSQGETGNHWMKFAGVFKDDPDFTLCRSPQPPLKRGALRKFCS
ncbi:hypothetical protein [Scytonema sp. NUACC26]|uniref:hypothetical protein n=1 Tax=Scytonema sp. NUACC26 TaxID=3140176 RepID=UPI0038B233E6